MKNGNIVQWNQGVYIWIYKGHNGYNISKKGESSFKFKTWLGKKEFVNATTKDDIFVTINKKSVKDFKISLKYNGPLKAPIKKGDEIGTLIVKESEDKIQNFSL